MPRSQLLDLQAVFYTPPPNALRREACKPFARYTPRPPEPALASGATLRLLFYAIKESMDTGEDGEAAHRSYALQLLHQPQDDHVLYLSLPLPLTATLLNQTVVLRYLYQQLLQRQRQQQQQSSNPVAGATTAAADSAVPHQSLLASAVDDTGAVRRIDLYKQAPGCFVAMIGLGGQHGAPHRHVAELVAGVMCVFAEQQCKRGCEPTILHQWPVAPTGLTIYDLCKTIKMVRQLGLLSAVYPLELLLVRALSALFGDCTDDYYKRRKKDEQGEDSECLFRLHTRSLVFLASTAVLESLPMLWRFVEGHDATHRMAQQEQRLLKKREALTTSVDDQAMLRTLRCTRTLLERHGIPTRKTDLVAVVDRSQYFWPPSPKRKKKNNKKKQEEQQEPADYWVVPPCSAVSTTTSASNAPLATAALCRSTFARILLAAFVHEDHRGPRCIDMHVFLPQQIASGTVYSDMLSEAWMHVQITLPSGPLQPEAMYDDETERSFCSVATEVLKPRATVRRVSSGKEVKMPLTSLYEWLQILLWTHKHVCFRLHGYTARTFFATNSSQHPYVLSDSNAQRLNGCNGANKGDDSNDDNADDDDAPHYSVVPVDKTMFDDDDVLRRAGSLVWYEQFAYVMRQYAMHVIQNVSIPDSCEF